MTWVRMDDKFPHHPKVMALGALRLAATGLHLEALCYCSEYLTDGIVPAAMVRKFPRKLVESLLAVGLWHRLGDGDVSLHDYLDYNPSREATEAHRGRVAEARSRAGKAGGIASAIAKQRASKTEANGSATPTQANGKPRPVPSRPVPIGSTSPLTYTARAGARRLVDLGELA